MKRKCSSAIRIMPQDLGRVLVKMNCSCLPAGRNLPAGGQESLASTMFPQLILLFTRSNWHLLNLQEIRICQSYFRIPDA
jgi:hypothetical protein